MSKRKTLTQTSPNFRLPPPPAIQHRMLTLAAALMLLPASAWSGEIAGVTITDNRQSTTQADDAKDVFSPDLIGEAAGGAIIKGAKNFANGSPARNPENSDKYELPLSVESNNNTVTVKGAVGAYSVVGGASVNSELDSTGNVVNVVVDGDNTSIGASASSAGSVVGGVGAYASTKDIDTGTGEERNPIITGPATPTTSNATGNKVNLTADTTYSITVEKDVIGGLSTHGNATENRVVIDGATAGVTIKGNVYGGSADSNEEALADGGDPHSASRGDALHNIVEIQGRVTIGEKVFGGATYHGNASNNTVTYKGGTGSTVGNITGGGATLGDTNENTVTISGHGTIASVVGGNTVGLAPDG
ncbi:MAG: hypothetical protein LBF91_06650, partial [Azoarcus sp.]|nr:hypothetical protein [Azoarcus sp.]